jgi:hypothetical protein
LPVSPRKRDLDELAQVMRRQVAAQVVYLYPKYRSTSDRFWDKPMREHVAQLVRRVLRDGALPWSELRRRLPDYAKILAETVLQDEVARRRLFQHPPLGPRLGSRYGLQPAGPEPYARQELTGVYERLAALGFNRDQARAALLEVLSEEESWESLKRLERPAGHFGETLIEENALGRTLVSEAIF